jgi:predicted HTH domain antitoxin
MLKMMQTKLQENTVGKINELAGESHIDTSTLLSRLIEDGLQIELLKRSTQLYAQGKVSMWKAAQMAGVSFYEMMAEIKKCGVLLQYGVDDFESDVRTLKKLKGNI